MGKRGKGTSSGSGLTPSWRIEGREKKKTLALTLPFNLVSKTKGGKMDKKGGVAIYVIAI